MVNCVVNEDLSCFAIQEHWSKRQLDEKDHKYRNIFLRDRDRILYSTEFRRLSGKTQVFVVGFDDNCRTRLTHTMEVAQIARTISSSIGLNVDLTEAIALGHDVGHTPFGHVGERFLSLLMNGCYNVRKLNQYLPDEERGFKHNWQSLRVVSSLEKYYKQYPNVGINLTNFTRWGILNHTKLDYDSCFYSLQCKNCDNQNKIKYKCGYMNKMGDCPSDGNHSRGFYSVYEEQLSTSYDWSYEAFVVAMADEIAQRHHDIEDGIIANIIRKDVLIDKIEELFGEFLSKEDSEAIKEIRIETKEQYYIPLLSRLIVNLLATKVIENSKENLLEIKQDKNINSSEDFRLIREKLNIDKERERISYRSKKDGTSFEQAEEKLKDFLYHILLCSNLAQRMDGKSNFLLRQITKAYVTNPQQLPDNTIFALFENFRMRLDKAANNNEIITRLKDIKVEIKDFNEKEIGLLRVTLDKLHKSGIKEYNYALLRTICDHISGMTDKYAIEQYQALYGSSSRF